MGRIYETVTETKTNTYNKLISRQCDLCGLKVDRIQWETGWYNINETEIGITIRQKYGETYPESGHGIEYIIDLCPNCFKNRLIPWLQLEGANLEELEWDY